MVVAMDGFSLDYLISALVTLIVVVDPVGLAPTFLAITRDFARSRTRIALRACIIAAAILAGTALAGAWLLAKLGISIAAFRIAGGLLLFLVASEMVLGVRIERQSKQAEEAVEEHERDVAAFPLAIPLMAGPGAITATLLLSGQANGRLLWLLSLLLVVVVVMTVCFAVYQIANRIDYLLGVTGNVVLSRLLGVLLSALAVQFVIDGVQTVLMR